MSPSEIIDLVLHLKLSHIHLACAEQKELDRYLQKMGRFEHIVNVASIQRQLSAVKEVHHSVQTNVGHATQFYLQPETQQRI